MSAFDFDPKERFSNRVDDYVKARPSYPGLIPLLTEVGLTPGDVIADIGSGTGISALPFLENGNTVYCVEPNAAMRASAEAQLSDHAQFRSVAGTAENTTLPDRSVDWIVVAQAFHWFNVGAARSEFGRILRSGGRVALIWNTRKFEGTPFLVAYEAFLNGFGTDYDRVRNHTARLTHGLATGNDPFGFFASGYQRHALNNVQRLDRAALTSRVLSASYIPAQGTARHDAMRAALDRLFDQHQSDGYVVLEYHIEVFVGTPAPDNGVLQ